MLAFLLSDLSYLTRADMSPTDASLCPLGPNTVTEEGKFYRHCWGTWPEEVLADHMSSTVFVSQMLSFLSPFHITRNLILSEERSPRVVPVRLETITGISFAFLITMVFLMFFNFWEEFGSKVNYCMNLVWEVGGKA